MTAQVIENTGALAQGLAPRRKPLAAAPDGASALRCFFAKRLPGFVNEVVPFEELRRYLVAFAGSARCCCSG